MKPFSCKRKRTVRSILNKRKGMVDPMKKATVFALVLGLVLALMAGCAPAQQQSPASPSPSETAQSTADQLKDKDGKIDVKYVGMVFPQMDHPWFIMVKDQIAAILEAAGVKVEVASCDNDQAKQLQLVENFGEKGVDGLILFPIGNSEIGGALEKLQEKGVRNIVFINKVDKGYDAMIVEDTAASGEECAKTAAAWIDKTFPDAAPGTIEVAVLSINMTPETAALSDGMRKITEFTSKAKLVVDYEMTFSDAATKAQENTEMLFVEHPDVKVILSYNHPLAVDEVVMRTKGVDLAKFGIFSNTFDTAVNERIAASRNNESVIRGLAISGNGTYDAIAEAMLGRVELTEDKLYYQPVSSITADNVDEYINK